MWRRPKDTGELPLRTEPSRDEVACRLPAGLRRSLTWSTA